MTSSAAARQDESTAGDVESALELSRASKADGGASRPTPQRECEPTLPRRRTLPTGDVDEFDCSSGRTATCNKTQKLEKRSARSLLVCPCGKPALLGSSA
jgi:hypothetical protein